MKGVLENDTFSRTESSSSSVHSETPGVIQVHYGEIQEVKVVPADANANSDPKKSQTKVITEKGLSKLFTIAAILCALVIIVAVSIPVSLLLKQRAKEAEEETTSNDGSPFALSPKKTATSSRYWDCNAGACGCGYWSLNNDPAHCYSNTLFEAPSSNPYGAKFYGTAAVSQVLFQGPDKWLGDGCSKCWKVTATSNVPGHDPEETALVLKGANLCDDPSKCLNNAHFDIAAPGFHVGWNKCDSIEPLEREGFQSCGGWMRSNKDPSENCDCSKFKDEVLRSGCENFLSLGWDMPEVTYQEVECPSELTQVPCWTNNGNSYSFSLEGYCASPYPAP